MKKVLIVSHPFPPTGGGGVQRVSKFVKYLPRFGWNPVVLSARPEYYPLRDESLLRDIPPDVRVERTFSLEPGRGALAVSAKTSAPGRAGGPIGWMIRASIGWLFVPDKSIGWVPFAVRAGRRLLAEERPDVVFATGNPFSSFLVPYLLRGVPYVLDFRDAWTLEPYRRRYPPWRERLEERLESKVLGRAASAVMATPPMAEAYAGRYPELSGKLRIVTNGYDEDDFSGVPARGGGRYTFLHSGSLYRAFRKPDAFLRAYRRALERKPEMVNGSRLLFVGSTPEGMQDLVAGLSLEGNVSILGYMPHREALEHLLGADALVLLCGTDRMEQSGKVFEYMRAGKPVIAVAREDGAAAQVVRECGGGAVVGGCDEAGIEEAIIRAFEGELGGGPEMCRVRNYSREELTGKLAEVLDEAV